MKLYGECVMCGIKPCYHCYKDYIIVCKFCQSKTNIKQHNGEIICKECFFDENYEKNKSYDDIEYLWENI